MKEIYYLDKEELPTIPVPHDCIIERIALKDGCIEFVFEDDIADHDSIQYYKPEARSLIIRYHLVDKYRPFYSIYKRSKPPRLISKLFRKEGCYKQLAGNALQGLTKTDYKLSYLDHYVGYCEIMIRLCADSDIIIAADIDYAELEWIV